MANTSRVTAEDMESSSASITFQLLASTLMLAVYNVRQFALEPQDIISIKIDTLHESALVTQRYIFIRYTLPPLHLSVASSGRLPCLSTQSWLLTPSLMVPCTQLGNSVNT